jgi:hypothetical protein
MSPPFATHRLSNCCCAAPTFPPPNPPCSGRVSRASPQPASPRHGHIVFIDGPDGSIRQGLFVGFAGEKLSPDDAFPLPQVADSEQFEKFRVVKLSALVRTELTTFKTLNRVRLHDLFDVGLIDTSWLSRLPPDLAPRLKEILDNPEG